MKKISTESKLVSTNPNVWEKTCPCCHNKYQTSSRTQKFCSEECLSKFHKKRRSSKRLYDSNKELERIRSRSHSLAVSLLEALVNKGLRKCQCDICGTLEGPLEVHHQDLNWLNNSPSNLQYLCVRCHHDVHTRFESSKSDIEKKEYFDKIYNPLKYPFLNRGI